VLLEQLSKKLENTIRKNSQSLTKTATIWGNKPSKKDEKVDLEEVLNNLKNLSRNRHTRSYKTRN